MSNENVILAKIPPKILDKKNYSDIILYALSNFGPLKRAEFDSLNRTTFYKYLNKLIEKELVVTNRKNKYAFYNITSLGEKKLSRRLIQYELDIETLLRIEERKNKRLISELQPFFTKLGLKDEEFMIEYIEISKAISLEKFKPLFSREKLNILTLFLALNHPKFYNYYSISTEGFLLEYNINLKDKITSAELMIFLERIMKNNVHDIKFYEFDLIKKGIKLYFRENCVSGKIFEIIVNSELNHFNYLSNLNKIEKNRGNLDKCYSEIKSILINDFNLFHPDFEESLGYLIDNYIKNIKLELTQKAKTRFSSKLTFFSLPERVRLPKITKNSLGITDSSFAEYLKKWKERNLGSENEFLKNAEEFYNNDQFDEALEEINKAIEFSPNVPEFYQRKASILSDLEKYDEALNTIENGIDIDPNAFLDILFKDKAEILLKMGLLDLALRAIDKSIELTEGWGTPYWVKAKILFEKGMYSDALKAIDLGIELDPERGEYYQNKAQILYGLVRFTEALEMINMAIEYDSRISSFYNFKAIILHELDKLNDALKTVDMGLDLDPNFIESYNTKGEILCEMRKFDEALKTVERGLNLDPNYIESYAIKGFILREMQKFDEALKIVEKGIKLDPSFLNFYDLKSMILTDMNKVQEALSVIETGIKLDPEHPAFYQLKAIILTELNQNEKAILAINKAIELDPNFSGNYHTKADVFYSFKHHDKAIKAIEKAINLEPKEELYYNFYGKIFMKKVMYKEAIKKFEKSVKLQPEGLITYESLINMGICYKELGQYKIALEKLEKGKEIAKKFNADESLETADRYILEIREKLI